MEVEVKLEVFVIWSIWFLGMMECRMDGWIIWVEHERDC